MKLLRRIVTWALPPVALALLALMLIPAETWREPENDFVYAGFDDQLLYVKETGSASAAGQVEIDHDRLSLTALEGSRPTVHLFTTPFDKVQASTDVRVLEAGDGRPLRLGIWSPREAAGFFLDFGGGTSSEVTARAIEDGLAGSSLLEGDIVQERLIGEYTLDQLQHVDFTLDKDAGVASFHVTGEESSPEGHPMIRLEGGPSDSSYHDVVSAPFTVEPGATYAFGANVKPISGKDAYKIVLQWLDPQGESLGFANDWLGVRSLDPAAWSVREFTATAPRSAVQARVYLGSGNATRLLFSDIFVRPVAETTGNLVPNGDLTDGDEGWHFVGGDRLAAAYVRPYSIDETASITRDELPQLFDSRRLTFTAVGETSGAISSALLSDYRLTVPHQRFYGVKTDDVRLDIALGTALAAAALVVALQAFVYFRERAARPRSYRHPARITFTRGVIACIAAAAVYFVGNALLFGLGNHPFDMTAERYWTYIAVTSGPAQLYYLPNFVSLADVWNGGPWHESVFPYGGVLAYIFTGIGALNAAFFSGPAGVESQGFSSEFLTKLTVVAFGFADAVLIYKIVQLAGQSRRMALIAAAAFLFNPAVWFSMSIWGQTHVISVFFALLGVWFMFQKNPTGAWLSLAAATLTRPQMVVPVFLLVVVLLKVFPLSQNVRSLCWTVVGVSLLFAPLSFAISPSLPVDILYNQFYFQEAGGNETAQTIVSLGAFNIWPVVAGFADGAAGVDRFHQLAADPLVGPLTYQRASQLIAASLVLMAAALIAFRSRRDGVPAYLLPVAIGTVGFFITKSGLAATHMLIVLPFLILCAGRMRAPAFAAVIAVWSLTTLVPMWGGVGEALTNVERLAPAFHADNNPLTWFFIELYHLDAFIVGGVLANVGVFAWLIVELCSPPEPRPVPAPQKLPFGTSIALEH